MRDDAPSTSAAQGDVPPSAATKARMPMALRALADRLGSSFGGLSAGARARLAAACLTFADVIQAGEDAPDGGVNLRPWPRFLLSALFSLELTVDVLTITEADEAWLVAEVEADVDGARALLLARTGIAPACAPTVPPLPVSQLIRS
jgi:hypothetical protein